MNPCSLQPTIHFPKGSARFALGREGKENEDNNEVDSDAESYEEVEDLQEEEGEELSEYEKLRRSNISRNYRVLKEFGLNPNLPFSKRRGGQHGQGKVCYVRLPRFHFNLSFYSSFQSSDLTFVPLLHHDARTTHTYTTRAHTQTHTDTASTEYETSFHEQKQSFE
jgi:hypothetical protein